MTPEEARKATFDARVQETVDKNLSEVARFAKAGNKGSYFTQVWRDEPVNQAAAKRLSDMGYRVGDGHVNW